MTKSDAGSFRSTKGEYVSTNAAKASKKAFLTTRNNSQIKVCPTALRLLRTAAVGNPRLTGRNPIPTEACGTSAVLWGCQISPQKRKSLQLSSKVLTGRDVSKNLTREAISQEKKHKMTELLLLNAGNDQSLLFCSC